MDNIAFITQGCSANTAETEIMQGLLKKAGYTIYEDPKDADIVVINICTVKGNKTALQQIKKTNLYKKHLIISGCITTDIIPEIRKIHGNASLISTNNIHHIVEVVEETSNGNTVEFLKKEYNLKVCLPKIRKNPLIGITPILNSCNSYCTFCSTRLVKGKLYSYPIESIVDDIKRSLNEGCKEIWITSQDNSAYMLDKQKTSQLPKLISKVLDIDKKFYLRIGMMNPSDLMPILDDLIKVYNDPRIFKFAHIPVQSGNDFILSLMKRRYMIDDFLTIVNEMKKKINHLTLSTDIIVGFPTETNQQFDDSLDLVKKIKPDILNISRYQQRHGTIASRMKQIHGNIHKERSRIMTKVFNEIAKNKNMEWINWRGKILIDEYGKNDTMMGRNFAYKPVIVSDKCQLGDEIIVKIHDATSYDLRAG